MTLDTDTMIDSLVDGAKPSQPFALFALAADDERSELARRVEAAVFLDAFGDTRQLLAEEYGPYESSTVFLVAVDLLRGRPVGAVRAISGAGGPPKLFSDLERDWGRSWDQVAASLDEPLDPRRSWELATWSVDPSYRSSSAEGLIGGLLGAAFVALANRAAAEWMVAIIDVGVVGRVEELLSTPSRHFPGCPPIPFLGSGASVPLWANIPRCIARLDEDDPARARLLRGLEGFEPVVYAPDWTALSDAHRVGA